MSGGESGKAVRGLLQTLASLRVGERALFLSVGGVAAGYPPLLVQPGTRAEANDRLIAMAEALPGIEAPVVTGTAWFDDEGVLTLAGADVNDPLLERLAAWAHQEVASEPRIGLLAGTRIQLPDVRGVRPIVIERRDLWEGIQPVRPRREGGTSAYARDLRALPRGSSARLWLARSGRGAPFAVIEPADAGSDVYRIGVQEADILGLDTLDDALNGVVRRLDGGRLSVTTKAPTDELATALRRYVLRRGPAHPALWELASAQCLTLTGDTLSALTTPLDPPELDTLRKVLPQLRDTAGACRAWFTSVAGDGAPRLLLGRSADELTRAADELGARGPVATGLLRYRDGFQFVTDRPFDGLDAHLAGFASAWRFDCKPLKGFRDLQIVLRSADGERPLSSTPALWAPFRS